MPDRLLPALTKWLPGRQEQILRAPNVRNIFAIAAALFTSPSDGVIVQPPVFFDFFDTLRENNREIRLNPLVLGGPLSDGF